ncbi:MAG: right-handed parallel beta-helix repeat-containing protein, partial [Persicimonas sp.]
MREGILSSHRKICIFVVTALAMLLGGAGVASAATYEVNSVGDQPDADLSDPNCRTEPGFCTLRAAIQQANHNPGPDTITFKLEGDPEIAHVITVGIGTDGAALPAITDEVTIDGTTEPDADDDDWPVIAVEGQLTESAHGFVFDDTTSTTAANSTIKGLTIHKFDRGGVRVRVDGVAIQDNFIGTNKRGTDCGGGNSGNNNGVILTSSDNVVDGNLLSCNTNQGVRIARSDGNRVIGNSIGTGIESTEELGNGHAGVYIFKGSANVLGESGASIGSAPGNVISHNGSYGVWLDDTDSNGNNVRRNMITENADNGVFVRGATRTQLLSNVVSNNAQHGVHIKDTTVASGYNTILLSNFIGTKADGTTAAGNSRAGVHLENASYNRVGNLTFGNTISANDKNGIVMTGAGSEGNLIQSNRIGAASDDSPLGNGAFGVRIIQGSETLIGGPGSVIGTPPGNRISFNARDGVRLDGANTDNTDVHRNRISDNDGRGVFVNGATNADVISNIISANTGDGVHALGNDSLDKLDTRVMNNAIGSEGAGNERHGVFFELTSSNLAYGNSITANGQHGVVVRKADDNIVRNNNISENNHGIHITKSDDNLVENNSVHDNHGRGMRLMNNSDDNLVTDNQVADNGLEGLAVIGNNSIGNSILETTFSDNGRLGIDLGADGVTPNDPLDGDVGPNNLQNFPKIQKAWVAHDKLFVKGKLHSEAEEDYKLQFFANDTCDDSGYGEGETFLGSTTVMTDVDGNTPFYFAVDADKVTGGQITATATRLDASDQPTDTSEFSKCKAIPLLKAKQGEAIEGKLEIEDAGPHTVLQFKLEALVDEDITLESIKLKAGGNGDDAADIEKVRLYEDTDDNGEPDGPKLAKGSYDEDNGYLELEFFDPYLLEGLDSKTFVVTYKMSSGMFASAAPLQLESGEVAFGSLGASSEKGVPTPVSLLILAALGLPAFMLGRRRLRIAAVTLVAAGSLVVLGGCVEADTDAPSGATQEHTGGPP